MQLSFSCLPPVLEAIEHALGPARLRRYAEGKGGRNHALRMYLWNARLCEALHLPVQIAEVCVRNALSRGLQRRFGDRWYQDQRLLSHLPPTLSGELGRVMQAERLKHGRISSDHVVSGLSLGFWAHLTTQTNQKIIWHGSICENFPNLPASADPAVIHDRLARLRRFRNRMAHHNAIFDKKPTAEYQNIQSIVGWICVDTLWLMRQVCNPARVIAERPRV